MRYGAQGAQLAEHQRPRRAAQLRSVAAQQLWAAHQAAANLRGAWYEEAVGAQQPCLGVPQDGQDALLPPATLYIS